MAGGEQLRVQQWLPGLEPRPGGLALARRAPRSPRGRPPRKSPSIDKIAERASVKVRKIFSSLRADLLREEGVSEGVHYDESSATFRPSYSFQQRELVRIDLDPVLAATVTLDPGERQLAQLLQSPAVPEVLKSKLVKCARKSGRRVFLAFLVRNGEELAAVLGLLRQRIALEG